MRDILFFYDSCYWVILVSRVFSVLLIHSKDTSISITSNRFYQCNLLSSINIMQYFRVEDTRISSLNVISGYIQTNNNLEVMVESETPSCAIRLLRNMDVKSSFLVQIPYTYFR